MPRIYIAKFDGTNWSALGSNGSGNGSLNNLVEALALDGSGNVYAGGGFTDVNNDGSVLEEADYLANGMGQIGLLSEALYPTAH